jgi:polysaccharide chain length determinant protein (PEP-CTERM system associated)
MEERQFHPLDYISVLRRRRMWFIVPLAACTLIGVLLALLLPRTYKSVAQIGVAAATLSPELLRGVSSMDPVERQRAVSQQLLSRAVLERVVREERINPEKPIEETVDWVRSRTVIDVTKPIGQSNSRTGLDSFDLAFLDATPERTRAIANRLAYVFVEENARTRTDRATNTSEVLAQQLRESQDRLVALEKQLLAKKQANMGNLPDQINANVSMLNGLRQSQQSIAMELRGEQERLTTIESQLASMQQGGASSAMTATSMVTIHGVQNRINGLQHELMQARALGWMDKHPEIVRIEAELKAARQELSSAQKAGNTGESVLLADPAYRHKIAERDGSRTRIKLLQAQAAQTNAQIARVTRSVEMAPVVEQDLAGIQRDYNFENERYKDLSGKHQSAIMAEELARKQGGERFSVLYPANLPGAPESPNIIRLLLMSVGLGFALGAGLVVAREFMDRSVHDVRALQTEFEIPVLGEIPRIQGA